MSYTRIGIQIYTAWFGQRVWVKPNLNPTHMLHGFAVETLSQLTTTYNLMGVASLSTMVLMAILAFEVCFIIGRATGRTKHISSSRFSLAIIWIHTLPNDH